MFCPIPRANFKKDEAMFFAHIFFFCGNVSRLDHVDQVNFAYLNSELSRKKKREAEGDARDKILSNGLGFVFYKLILAARFPFMR